MFVVAKRYLKNSSQAEEAMQDAFVKAFKNLSQFKGEVSFGAWLKRIVINQCFDLLKKNELETISIEEQIIEVLDDNDWEVNDDYGIQNIKETIELMPVKYRSVLKLYLIDGFDHKEISEFMGILETTSRSLYLEEKTS